MAGAEAGTRASRNLFGIVNAAVALWSTFLFRERLPSVKSLRAASIAVLLLLGVGMIASDRISATADDQLYADDIIFERNTPYQRIVHHALEG